MSQQPVAVELFSTSILSNHKIRSRHERFVSILQVKKIPFVYHDLASDEDAKSVWRAKSLDKQIPGLLVHGEWRGTFEEFEEAIEFGELDLFLRIDQERAKREAADGSIPQPAPAPASASQSECLAPEPAEQKPRKPSKHVVRTITPLAQPRQPSQTTLAPSLPMATPGSVRRKKDDTETFLRSLGIDDLNLTEEELNDLMQAGQSSAGKRATSSEQRSEGKYPNNLGIGSSSAKQPIPRTYVPSADAGVRPLRLAKMGDGTVRSASAATSPHARYNASQTSSKAMVAEAQASLSSRSFSTIKLREAVSQGENLKAAMSQTRLASNTDSAEQIVGREDINDLLASLGLNDVNMTDEEAEAFLFDGAIPSGLGSGGDRVQKTASMAERARNEAAARDVAQRAREKGYGSSSGSDRSRTPSLDTGRPKEASQVADAGDESVIINSIDESTSDDLEASNDMNFASVDTVMAKKGSISPKEASPELPLEEGGADFGKSIASHEEQDFLRDTSTSTEASIASKVSEITPSAMNDAITAEDEAANGVAATQLDRSAVESEPSADFEPGVESEPVAQSEQLARPEAAEVVEAKDAHEHTVAARSNEEATSAAMDSECKEKEQIETRDSTPRQSFVNRAEAVTMGTLLDAERNEPDSEFKDGASTSNVNEVAADAPQQAQPSPNNALRYSQLQLDSSFAALASQISTGKRDSLPAIPDEAEEAAKAPVVTEKKASLSPATSAQISPQIPRRSLSSSSGASPSVSPEKTTGPLPEHTSPGGSTIRSPSSSSFGTGSRSTNRRKAIDIHRPIVNSPPSDSSLNSPPNNALGMIRIPSLGRDGRSFNQSRSSSATSDQLLSISPEMAKSPSKSPKSPAMKLFSIGKRKGSKKGRRSSSNNGEGGEEDAAISTLDPSLVESRSGDINGTDRSQKTLSVILREADEAMSGMDGDDPDDGLGLGDEDDDMGAFDFDIDLEDDGIEFEK